LPPTSLVALINAAHFQALWANSWNKILMGSFISPDGLVNTSYMSTIASFYYLDSEELRAKIIRLPYADRKFSMIVALPNQKKTGLVQLVEDFSKVDSNQILRDMDATTVSVLLPQFKLNYTTSLNDVMRSIQIERVFTPNASMSSLAVPTDTEHFPEGAAISGVFHGAGIVVDHKSANNNKMSAASDNRISDDDTKMPKFNACWPFLFFILDETTGGILFTGIVSKPEYVE
jgi:serine protease inhibitor